MLQRHNDLHALAWVRNQAAWDVDVPSTCGLAVGLGPSRKPPGAWRTLLNHHDAFRLSRPNESLRNAP